MQALSEKFMSDEETDDENNSSLIKRSLTWRSEKLNKLIVKLDERYFHSRERKENSKPMKNRRKGNPSERLPLANSQIWATISPELTFPVNSAPELTSPVNSAPELTSPVNSAPVLTSPPLTSTPDNIELSCVDEDMDAWLSNILC